MNYKMNNHMNLNREKVNLLITKLQPIIDWSSIKIGTHIFHKSSNNVFAVDKLVKINEDRITYINVNGIQLYEQSMNNWYFYDESIADEVNEYLTPKLWWSKLSKYPEDLWICVSCNIEELYDRWVKEHSFKGDLESWLEQIEYCEIKELDGYSIKVQ